MKDTEKNLDLCFQQRLGDLELNFHEQIAQFESQVGGRCKKTSLNNFRRNWMEEVIY